MQTPGSKFVQGTVAAGGFTLDYAEASPDRPLATIVSLPGSAGLEMSTAKDRLSEVYRVIEINPPGWGGKTDLTEPMSQKTLGAILAEAATKLVPDGRFHVIGTSMGGTNALYLAEAAPNRVAGVILEGSMAPCRGEDLHSGPVTPEQRNAMLEAMAKNEATDNYPVPPPHPNKAWATADFVRRQMGNRAKMMRLVEPDFTAASAMTAVRNAQIPVLALLGDQDEILKLSQSEAVAGALPQARFVTIPGGMHDLQNTTPDAFVAQVREFVGS